jgi:D-mannonate dehydratase
LNPIPESAKKSYSSRLALLTYREVEYPYMMMPDHVPYHADDPGGSQAFAFAYGYIRALIQTVDQLG